MICKFYRQYAHREKLHSKRQQTFRSAAVIRLKCSNFLFGSLRGFYCDGGEDGADAAVEGMEFDVDLCGDGDPIPGVEQGGADELAGETHKLDVCLAAGHHKAAGGEHSFPVLAELCHLTLEAHGLLIVLLRLFGDIPIPQMPT